MYQVGLLHNKVDKMVRLMVETSENQKKMNKVLQDLLKVNKNVPTQHCPVQLSFKPFQQIRKPILS